MKTQRNRRGHTEQFLEGRHLKLNDLKREARGLIKKYLIKRNIPPYPRPEFHASHLKHDTDRGGLSGIRKDGGFRDPGEAPLKLLWWSLSVGPDDITAAETRLLEKTFPHRTKEQAQMQPSFLWKFATSPAFMETSRLGSYRFTFPLEEMLEAYSQQFCSGAQPVVRVYRTVLYKQEVVHVVLVHSPDKEQQFSGYPLLSDDPNAVCVYRDGRFIWRPEAMCETHSYKLVQRPDENQMEVEEVSCPQFCVWDHVAVALHIEKGQVLQFDADRLRENLSFCEKGKPTITNKDGFDKFSEAEKFVKELWPDYPASLRKEKPLQQVLADDAPLLQEPRSALDGKRLTQPQTLIVGDFTIKEVKSRKNIHTCCFPKAEVRDMTQRIPDILAQHPGVENIIIHIGANDIRKQQSEVLKRDFTDLFISLRSLDAEVFISGPLPPITRRVERFSRLFGLNTWLSTACTQHQVHFIENFNLFWHHRRLFRADGTRLNKQGVKRLISNLLYCLRHSSVPYVKD